MPKATPLLRRLRQQTGMKSGPWADTVEYNRNQYVNVESGRRSASLEFFIRCAALLTTLLGEKVSADDLMEAGNGGPRVRHATSGGSAAESTETAQATEATEATDEAEEDVRSVA